MQIREGEEFKSQREDDGLGGKKIKLTEGLLWSCSLNCWL